MIDNKVGEVGKAPLAEYFHAFGDKTFERHFLQGDII